MRNSFISLPLFLISFFYSFTCIAQRTDTIKVKVHDHIMTLYSAGAGKPNVILEAGGGSTHRTWQLVQPKIANSTRVVSYDRPGYLNSDTCPSPRDAITIAKELKDALIKANIHPPYIFAGWSYGGSLARVFAGLYPKDVEGMVLVDPAPEEVYARFEREFPEVMKEDEKYIQEILNSKTRPGEREEMRLYDSSMAQARRSDKLHSTPTTLLIAAGKAEGGQDRDTSQPMARIWVEELVKWAKKRPNLKYEIIANSGHHIARFQPDTVVKALRYHIDQYQEKAPKRSATPYKKPDQLNARILPVGFKYSKPERFADSVYEGYIDVFENRVTDEGKKIRLYVIIVPAVVKTNNTPVFMIDGGPGVSATGGADFFATKENPYRQNRDVVIVDVRGTGKSNPLMCPSLQVKENLQQQFDEMYPVPAVKECYDQLSKQNDLTQYHTTNIVKDLEEVRIKLGYKKISLFGLSYGTRVSLQYMRMYPKAIESTVLWSPATTYLRMPLYHATFAQASLNMIWDDCRKDTACNKAYPLIKNEFIELMKRWKAKPVTYELKDSAGNNQTLLIPWHAFQTKIRSVMYTPAGIRTIPYLVHQAWKENLQPFIDLFPKGKTSNDFIAEGLYLCVTCTEDVPFIQPGEIKSLTAGTFTGTYRVDQQKRACANWVKGKIPTNFLQPVSASIPTLILSGSFDPVTPPSVAKEIMRTLSNSQLVEIPYMSHIFDGLSNESCFDNLVIEFLAAPQKKLRSLDCTKSMMPPPYKLTQ